MKKIIFMGTPDYASKVLEAFLKASDFKVLAIFTQADKPQGRKNTITPPSVKKRALELDFAGEIFQPLSLKEQGISEKISALKPDFIVVAAYGQILPKSILELAPCINLHASILPKYRGASPISQMILEGQKLNGISAMKMSQGLDDGDMLGFYLMDITNKSAQDLFEQFSNMAAKLALKILREYENIAPLKQFNALASKCKKIRKDDGLISLNMPAQAIWRKFLAYKPWPGVYLANGLKILDISISLSKNNAKIGTITNISADSFSVALSDGELIIKSLQEVSKKPLDAKEYINGKRLKFGDSFC